MRDEVPKDEWEVFIEMLTRYSELRDYLMRVMEKHSYDDNKLLSVIYNHMKFISDRSVAISVLIQQNLLWDAEIVLRAVLEATVKTLFLCNATESERTARLNEYLSDFPEINALKHSDQAKKIVASVDSSNELVRPFTPLILDFNDEERLKSKWTRKRRKELEQKWAFSEILREQAEKMSDYKDLVLNVAHSYRISSHLIHADEMGIGIIAERASRSEEEILKIERAHFCSILSNCFYYLFLAGISMTNYLKEDIKPLLNIKTDLDITLRKIQLYNGVVFGDEA